MTPQHVGERFLEFGAADGVELDVGVVHLGLVVGPLADLRRGTLSFEFCGFGVDAGALVTLGGEEPDKVAAPGQELLDPLPTCRRQKRDLFGNELGSDLVVEPDEYGCDCVDVATRDRPVRQRRFEQWHRIAGRNPLVDDRRVASGALPGVVEQRLRRLRTTLSRQLTGPAGTGDIDRIEPGPHRPRAAHDRRHFVAVSDVRFSR